MGDHADDCLDAMYEQMLEIEEDRWDCLVDPLWRAPKEAVVAKQKTPSKTIQARGIASYVQIFEPQLKTRKDKKTNQDIQVAIYILDLLLPKDSPAIEPLRALVMETGTKEWGPDVNKWPEPKYDKVELAGMIATYGADKSTWPIFKFPAIRDQGEKEVDLNGQRRQGYVPGNFFISPSSKYKPPVVDFPDCNEIIDASKLYGGCEILCELNAYTYEYMGNVGVKFGLIAIQKVGEGTPFGTGRPDPTKIFSKPAPTTGGAGRSAGRML